MGKLAVIVLLCAGMAFAQALPDHPQQCSDRATRATIASIAEAFKAGYNAGDPDRVAALYADDATYLTQHFLTGIVHGRRAIRAYVKNGTEAKYKIDSLTVLTSGCEHDFAWAITRYESTNGGQKAFGLNLVLIRKIKGKWLIVAHESAVPDPERAIPSLDVE